jgi:Protein of unknown function (DUF3040)
MILSNYEQSRLCRIEASLRRSDPKLAGMLGMFGRLCPGQRMPAWEQAPSRLDRTRQAAALLAAAAAVIAAAAASCLPRPAPWPRSCRAADRIWPGGADYR